MWKLPVITKDLLRSFMLYGIKLASNHHFRSAKGEICPNSKSMQKACISEFYVSLKKNKGKKKKDQEFKAGKRFGEVNW